MKKEEYYLPFPEGFTADEMNKAPSVLGGISLLQDFDLIKYAIETTVYHSPKWNIKAIHKAFLTVQTQEWQKKYNPSMAQMFKMYLQLQAPDFILIEKARLQIAFACMIIEGYLFKAEFPSQPSDLKISKKIKLIFDAYYGEFGREMYLDAAWLIGAIRNGVTHEGGLSDLISSLKENEVELLNRIANGQKMPSERFLSYYTSEFNYLFEDVMLRSLGLTQDELGWNGRPAWNSNYWRKEYWEKI